MTVSRLSDVSILDSDELRNLARGHDNLVTNWEGFLKDLKPQVQGEVSVFKLDPNQLLSVSGGYKVLLKRPFGN